jgi:rubrerythrin
MTAVVALIVVVPLVAALALTLLAFRGMTPLAFRCRRCNTEFRRQPHRDFPSACPACGARDWNA